jgi:hypothetical protein
VSTLVCPILLVSKCVIFNWKGDLQKDHLDFFLSSSNPLKLSGMALGRIQQELSFLHHAHGITRSLHGLQSSLHCLQHRQPKFVTPLRSRLGLGLWLWQRRLAHVSRPSAKSTRMNQNATTQQHTQNQNANHNQNSNVLLNWALHCHLMKISFLKNWSFHLRNPNRCEFLIDLKLEWTQSP